MKKSILLVMMLSMSSLLFAQRHTKPPSAMVAGPQKPGPVGKEAPDATGCLSATAPAQVSTLPATAQR
jgi:hypothetical protein